MRINTAFDVGQVVYAVRSELAESWVPCGFCAASSRVVGANGETRPCPVCYGRGGRREWFAQARRLTGTLTIGQVRVAVTQSPGLEGEETFRNYMPQETHVEKYMAVETGVGSGTVWKAADLFATRDEAQAACEERNCRGRAGARDRVA